MPTFLNDSPVFGPVRSRRLGVSLGVNMMPATGKICTFDCLYCENGLNEQRRCAGRHNSAQTVAAALEAKLRQMRDEGELPDVITFAGNGEPTAAPASPCATSSPRPPRSRFSPTGRWPRAPKSTTRSCS